MPSSTQVLASRILFTEVTRGTRIPNQLSAGDPVAVMERKAQSSPHAPVVRVVDLTKNHGTDVMLDVVHELKGRPILGDDHAEGKEESLSFANQLVKIDAYLKTAKGAEPIKQQKVSYQLNTVSMTSLKNWYMTYTEDRFLIQAAGARGYLGTSSSNYNDSWTIPLESDTVFAREMVNKVTPPTFNRANYGGNANSITSIGVNDVLSLDTLSVVSEKLQETSSPLLPIDLSTEDKPMGIEPFYCLYVTPRQWTTLKATTTIYDQLVANAHNRSQGFNHPLFRGDCLMYDNILVKKYLKPVRFYSGNSVSVCDDNADATVSQQTVPTNVNIDRAILFGGQAIAHAFGKETKSEQVFTVINEAYDVGKRKHRQGIAFTDGIIKIRFKDKQGRTEDRGIMTIDTAINL